MLIVSSYECTHEKFDRESVLGQRRATLTLEERGFASDEHRALLLAARSGVYLPEHGGRIDVAERAQPLLAEKVPTPR